MTERSKERTYTDVEIEARLAHHDVAVRVGRQQRARRTDVRALEVRAQHARLLARVDRRRASGRAPVGAERKNGVGGADLT